MRVMTSRLGLFLGLILGESGEKKIYHGKTRDKNAWAEKG